MWVQILTLPPMSNVTLGKVIVLCGMGHERIPLRVVLRLRRDKACSRYIVLEPSVAGLGVTSN